MTTKNTPKAPTPLTPCVAIKELRRVELSWKQAHLSAQEKQKMLRLYLGESAWMNAHGVYPRENFYEISAVLKFRSVSTLLECLQKSMGFGFIWTNPDHNIKSLVAFFSPLWFDYMKAKNQKSQLSLQQMRHSIVNNNINYIYNITYNGATDAATVAAGSASADSSAAQKGSEQAMTQFELQSRIAAFIKFLCNDDDAYNAVVADINKETEAALPVLRPANHQEHYVNLATKRYLEVYLQQYFFSNGKKFRNAGSYKGLLIWIQNMKRYSIYRNGVAHAVDDIRRELGKNAGLLMRQNHPVSPYEYQDPQTLIRLYDQKGADGKLEQVQIPAGAPPRPSDTATWDNWEQCWRNS